MFESNELFLDYQTIQNNQRASNHAQTQVGNGMGSRTPANQYYMNSENGSQSQMSQTMGFGSGYQQGQCQNPVAITLPQINSVTQEALLASGNKAFMSLFLENVRLKAELDARNEILAHFKEKDKQRGRSRSPDDSTGSRTTILPPTFTLAIPPSPDLLSSHDYYEVPFWDVETWREHDQKERAKGNIPSRLGFITDSEGQAVSSARLSEMVNEANLLWASLYSAREDPQVWKKKTKTASEYFSNSMRSKFIEFRLCQGDWKVEIFASTKFSDWNRNSRMKGTLKRTMPSINVKAGTGKRKADEVDTKPRPPKKMKREMLPVSVEVIDLDSSGEDIGAARPSSPKIAGSSTGPGTSAAITRNLNLKTPAPSTPSEPRSSSLSDIASPPAQELAETRLAPESGSNGPPPEAATTEENQNTSQEGAAATITPQSTTVTAASDDASAGSSTTEQPEDALKNAPCSGRRVRNANPLSNIPIPKLANELLAPIVVQESAAASVPSSSSSKSPPPAKNMSKKAPKLMVPNKSVTARNLFAIDYIKSHPVTAAEFRAVYAALDGDTLKKYEALSREKKKITGEQSDPTAAPSAA